MNQKAQGLPINVVIMMIIGLVIFTLGMSLFFQVYNSGEDMVGRMNENIRTDISARECSGNKGLCAPSFSLSTGDGRVFRLQMTNQKQTEQTYSIDFEDSEKDDSAGTANQFSIDQACGSILVTPATNAITLQGGASAWFPFHARIRELKEGQCSFIFTARLMESGVEVDRQAVTISVDS